MDAHPSLFSAAALEGPDPVHVRVDWIVDRLPLEGLERWLEERVHPDDLIVLEASGNSFALVQRIEALGRKALVLESASVGKIGKTYCATDKLDAVKIARVYLSGLAHVVWTPDAKTRERRSLFFAYRNTVKDATRCRNRIWAFFNEQSMRRPKNLRLSDPSSLNRVLAMRSWTPLQQTLLKSLWEEFGHAEQHRKQWNALIAEEVTSDPTLLKLVRLLGVRHIIAFALAAFVGDVTRFRTPKQLVAYFGLNPCVSISGQGGGTGSLAHTGRSDVRSLLIQAAQSILRYGRGSQHKWALALKMRKGTNIAIAALARKLTVASWYLMQGFFSPLTEISGSLRIKIRKIAIVIGKQRILQLGYKTRIAFEDEKIHILLQTI